MRSITLGCIVARHVGTAWRLPEREETIGSKYSGSGAPLQRELRGNLSPIINTQLGSMAPGLPRTPPRDRPQRDSTGVAHGNATSHLGSLEGGLVGLAPVRHALQGKFAEMLSCLSRFP